MPEETLFVEVPGKKNRKGKLPTGLLLGGTDHNAVLKSTDPQLNEILPGDIVIKVESQRFGGFPRKALGWVDVERRQNVNNTIVLSSGTIRLTLLRPSPPHSLGHASACSDFEDRHGLTWKNNKLVDYIDETPFNYNKFHGDKAANDRRYEDICQSLVDYIYKKLETDYGMTRTYIPFSRSVNEPVSFIYKSEAFETKTNLLILILGSGSVTPGIWSRRVCINDDLEVGSQFTYIRAALSRGWGVLILNPNRNRDPHTRVPIKDNDTSEAHCFYVWNHIISACSAINTFVVAHSAGVASFCSAAEKLQPSTLHKIRGIAFSDQDPHATSLSVQTHFNSVARYWKQSHFCLDEVLGPTHPCISTVSAGTPFHDRVPGTIAASVISFFDYCLHQKRNLQQRASQVMVAANRTADKRRHYKKRKQQLTEAQRHVYHDPDSTVRIQKRERYLSRSLQISQSKKRWYARNKESVKRKNLGRAKHAYATNPRPILDRARQAYATNPQPILDRARQAYATNPNPTLENAKRAYIIRSKQFREKSRMRYEKKTESIRAKAASVYASNPQPEKIRKKKYYQAHSQLKRLQRTRNYAANRDNRITTLRHYRNTIASAMEKWRMKWRIYKRGQYRQSVEKRNILVGSVMLSKFLNMEGGVDVTFRLAERLSVAADKGVEHFSPEYEIRKRIQDKRLRLEALNFCVHPEGAIEANPGLLKLQRKLRRMPKFLIAKTARQRKVASMWAMIKEGKAGFSVPSKKSKEYESQVRNQLVAFAVKGFKNENEHVPSICDHIFDNEIPAKDSGCVIDSTGCEDSFAIIEKKVNTAVSMETRTRKLFHEDTVKLERWFLSRIDELKELLAADNLEWKKLDLDEKEKRLRVMFGADNVHRKTAESFADRNRLHEFKYMETLQPEDDAQDISLKDLQSLFPKPLSHAPLLPQPIPEEASTSSSPFRLLFSPPRAENTPPVNLHVSQSTVKESPDSASPSSQASDEHIMGSDAGSMLRNSCGSYVIRVPSLPDRVFPDFNDAFQCLSIHFKDLRTMKISPTDMFHVNFHHNLRLVSKTFPNAEEAFKFLESSRIKPTAFKFEPRFDSASPASTISRLSCSPEKSIDLENKSPSKTTQVRGTQNDMMSASTESRKELVPSPVLMEVSSNPVPSIYPAIQTQPPGVKPPSSNAIMMHDPAEKGPKVALHRRCDADCHEPLEWGLMLFDRLLRLFKLKEKDLFRSTATKTQKKKPRQHVTGCSLIDFLRLEECRKCEVCLEQGDSCDLEGGCTDVFRWFYDIQPHHSGIRNLTRRLLRIREKANWIADFRAILIEGSFKDLRDHINALPNLGKNKPLEDVLEANRIPLAQMLEPFMELCAQFQAKVYEVPTHTCHSCNVLGPKSPYTWQSLQKSVKHLVKMRRAHKKGHGKSTAAGSNQEMDDDENVPMAADEEIGEIPFGGSVAPKKSMNEWLNDVDEEGNNDAMKEFIDFCIHYPKFCEGRRYPEQLCKNCYTKLRVNAVPVRSMINGMIAEPLPTHLKPLSHIEKMLIQPAKPFLNMIQMSNVSGKRPAKETLDGLKGNIVYLPLDTSAAQHHLKRTLKLPSTESIHIIVRGMPTGAQGNKKIRQYLVDVLNVHNYLVYLKKENYIYKDITIMDLDEMRKELPDMLHIDFVDQQITGQLTEEEARSIIQHTFGSSNAASHCDHTTIIPINTRALPDKENIELYQQRRVEAAPLSFYTNPNLDVECFPFHFPSGKYGLNYPDRRQKIFTAEYIKCLIKHSDDRWRKDPQFIFHLLTLKDAQAINAATFAQMHVGNLSGLTAGRLRQNIQNKDPSTEASLRMLLGSMTGTEEYWRNARNEIEAMTRQYGPATFILTITLSEFNTPFFRESLKKFNPLGLMRMWRRLRR